MDYRYFPVGAACTFNSNYDGPIRKLSKITQKDSEKLFTVSTHQNNIEYTREWVTIILIIPSNNMLFTRSHIYINIMKAHRAYA